MVKKIRKLTAEVKVARAEKRKARQKEEFALEGVTRRQAKGIKRDTGSCLDQADLPQECKKGGNRDDQRRDAARSRRRES
jgi:translation initiation factor 2B subunit (eIF-2B alpha/beta/delta family)